MLAMVWSGAPAWAQSPVEELPADSPRDQPLLRIGDEPIYRAVRQAGAELKHATGLDLSLDYTFIFQASTGGLKDNDVAIDTLHLNGLWTVWDRNDGGDRGALGFQLRHRGAYTDGGTPPFTRSLGTLWAPNDFPTGSQDHVRELWWRQQGLDGRLQLDVGKLHMRDLLDRNRFAQSVLSQFLAQPFNNHNARAYPQPGLGVRGKITPIDGFYLQAAMADGTAVVSHSPFNTIDDGNWFYAGEAGLTIQPFDLGPGTYRLTCWKRDNGVAVSDGLTLSFDQELTPDFGAFLRVGHKDGRIGPVRNMISTGVTFLTPFGRQRDQAGLGFSWTNPADSDRRNEYLFEAYYRIQLTEGIELTPDCQLIVDPSDSSKDVLCVFGLRLRHRF